MILTLPVLCRPFWANCQGCEEGKEVEEMERRVGWDSSEHCVSYYSIWINTFKTR
jgi:hypothetical protein